MAQQLFQLFVAERDKNFHNIINAHFMLCGLAAEYAESGAVNMGSIQAIFWHLLPSL
jgi:hypothetical protein